MEEISNAQNQTNQQPQQLQPVGGGETPVKSVFSKKKRGGLLAMIIILVILGAAGVAAFALSRGIWDPVWNPFRPNPDAVIKDMIAKMQTVKTLHSVVDMTVDNPGKLKINTVVDSDMTDMENIKSDGDMSVSFVGDIFGAGSEQTISAKIKIRNIGQDQYINFENIEAPSLDLFLAMLGINFNNIKGSWIKLPTFREQDAALDASALVQKMQKMISGTKFYVVKQQLPEQIIDGKRMYNYLISLDNEKIAQLIEDLIAEAKKINSVSAEDTVIITKETILDFLNKAGEINVELSIGKDDRFLYRTKLKKSIDMNRFNVDEHGLVDIVFETNASKFNQPVSITAPAKSKTFQDFIPQLGGIMSNLILGATQSFGN